MGNWICGIKTTEQLTPSTTHMNYTDKNESTTVSYMLL